MDVQFSGLVTKFVISLIMGAIIGIERERRAKGIVFAGFRTFMLVCSLGLISAFLYDKFNPIFSFYSFLILGFLCSINFYRKIIKEGEAGITSEIALLLTYFIGFIFYFESKPYLFSLSLTFILTLILFLKEKLHEFAHKLKVEEIRDFLIFGLISFVIYPILPTNPIDPLQILDLKFVWFALILILGLSFFAYIMIKLLKKEGIIVNAFLGGLINSIYVSNFFSSKLKNGKIVKYSILISLSSLLNRLFILSILINISNIKNLLFLPLISFVGYLIGFKNLRNEKLGKEKLDLKSPLDLKFAFSYMLLFVSIFYIANLIYIKFSKEYIYFLLPIGIVDTSSLTVTLSSILLPIEFSKFLTLLIILNIFGNFMVVYKNNKNLAKECLDVFLFLIFMLIVFNLIFVMWEIL
ncbi:MAG: DUF4010 domain-containing protein [Candidatus Aenigmatarchaeota archaeon]